VIETQLSETIAKKMARNIWYQIPLQLFYSMKKMSALGYKMNGTDMIGFAIAIYIGMSLTSFFGSISRDLITPVITGIFPGVQQSIEKITVKVGPVTLNIGEAVGATINLLIVYLVVSLTLPFVRSYAPIGGKHM
jgi:large-conductance mechanosensitive channel